MVASHQMIVLYSRCNHVASIEPPRPRLVSVVGGLFCAMRVYHSILLSLSIIQPTGLNGPLSRCPRKRTARSTRSKPSSVSRHIFPLLG